MEGLFIAVGVSVGTAQLSGGDDNGGSDSGSPQGRHQTLSSELVLAVCGAVLIAANVAPTDEILFLASEMSPIQLLGTMSTSLMLAATLLYFSDFTGSARFAGTRALFGVAHGTVITYAAALASSAACCGSSAGSKASAFRCSWPNASSSAWSRPSGRRPEDSCCDEQEHHSNGSSSVSASHW